MNKNINLKDFTKLEDYEFSTRLDYILKCLGKSRKDFYNELKIRMKNNKVKIEERTFVSYFGKSIGNKRLPKKQTTELMAEALEVEMWMLVPKADDFEKIYTHYINFYSNALNVRPEYVFDLISQEADMDEIESCENEGIYNIFIKKIIKFQEKDICDKVRRGILCILQYYVDNKALHIDKQIYDIINCFFQLNEKGKEKIILYGKIIIKNVINESGIEPLYDITQLCKKYNVNYNELLFGQENQNNKKIGKINLTILEKDIYKQAKFDYNTIGFLNMLDDLSTCRFSHLSIVLICIFMDNKNTPLFADDILESYLLIAELFSRDEEFQNN